MSRRSSGCGYSHGPSLRARSKAGASAGRVAGTVVSRTERRTKSGSKMGIIGLSDPSGHYEAVLFAEGLAAVPRSVGAGQGGAVCSSPPKCRATRCAPAFSRSSRSTRRRPGCSAVCGFSCATRAACRRGAPARSAGREARNGADAARARSAWCCCCKMAARSRSSCPGRFKVSPQIAGAIKAVPGVVTVEAL